LARLGAHICLAARNEERGNDAAAKIRATTGNEQVTFLGADLSSTGGVRKLAATVREQAPALDILINNAGAMFGKRTENEDGIEKTFALNHLAYYSLTLELLPLFEKAPGARIINVASQAHRGATLDFSDLQCKRNYEGWRVYKKSKLANILFTRSLAPRLSGMDITVNALHPGFVATNFGTANAYLPKIVWRGLTSLFAIDVESGAKSSVYLASAPEAARLCGRYINKCAEAIPSPAARDEKAATKLWLASEEMTGLRFP
jgi:NAD(P)-dependent dehydrogenase (short-subunit alcohol dehydrogenase family)